MKEIWLKETLETSEAGEERWGGRAWRRCRRRSRWGSSPRRWTREPGGWSWWSRGSTKVETSLRRPCNFTIYIQLKLNWSSPHFILTTEELVAVDEHSGDVADEEDDNDADEDRSEVQFLLGGAPRPLSRKPENYRILWTLELSKSTWPKCHVFLSSPTLIRLASCSNWISIAGTSFHGLGIEVVIWITSNGYCRRRNWYSSIEERKCCLCSCSDWELGWDLSSL